ncbi:MAG: 1-acyl-sn-glycerol-3-phosphate acyltransferase [Acidimicrobiia bacterium]|nr:1-acyl-sn-glycerol-3-phosphate acyltransferase [Acidimicrobiia bacterium]
MRLLRRDPGRFVDLSYRVARPIVAGFNKLYFDYEARYLSDLPRRGAFIVAANHHSLVDPVFTSLVAFQNIRFLAVDELFGRSRFFDSLTGFWGAIPMPRGRIPFGALKTAIRTIEAGRPVGVYPESRRTDYWGETPPSRGAAWLALFTGAPIYPVAMEGTEGVLSYRAPRFQRASIRATVCEPVDPLDFMDREDPLQATIEAWEDRMIQVLGPLRTAR